jgi:DNA-directed RNA polymerase specialized sigma24 family protein
MPNAPANVLRYLRRLAAGADTDPVPDRELLDRFVARQDEEAFAALVRRHGPMVLRLCRRSLPTEQDAEDVFQATFLVLCRKATALQPRDSLAAWLYGVTYRLALKARTQAARRRARPSWPCCSPAGQPPRPPLPVCTTPRPRQRCVSPPKVPRPRASPPPPAPWPAAC